MTRILVVDDVLDNIKLLDYELADEGYEILKAQSGAEALAIARECAPDVILLDVMMPVMDGVEVCRRLKADPGLRPIPVVMLSAREEEQVVILALDAGAQDYVTKPFNAKVLLARVRSAARAKADHDTIIELNRQLARQATVDGLTGAKNRGHFQELFEKAMSLARRQELPLSLVILDVDHFKSYNDTFGHPAGDDVLRTVVGLLSAGLRSHDTVARFGGEEFVVLMPATDAIPARLTAERLQVSLATHAWPLRSITASFGVATWTGGPMDPDELLARADRALYHAKQTGRDRVVHEFDLDPQERKCPTGPALTRSGLPLPE